MQFSLFLFIFFSTCIYAQDLPKNYYYSNNDMQLNRGFENVLDGFYSELVVDTIFLYFEQDDYWQQMLDNYCDKINISATLIYKGEVFNEVGVRFKGQTSFANTNGSNNGGPGGGGPGGGGPGGGGPGGSVDTDKKSFNIELDWVNNQDIDGYETINLNNCYQDPSFLREFLFSKISRNYIPSVNVNFIQLMINDQNWGVYPNVQQLDKKHAGEWFFDDECTRWRAEDPNSTAPGCGDPISVGGPGGGGPDFGAGLSSLNYLGLDTLNYLDHYTLKKKYKENPWIDLINACQVIDSVNEVDDLEVYNYLNNYLDIDAVLWYLADEIIFSDDDSYVNKGGMDYYIYYDIYNERILPIEYDGNTVFGNPNWSPFYNEDDPDFVMLNNLLSVNSLRERYLAHFRTILTNSFEQEYIESQIDEYANMIDLYVYNDPQKIYTYSEFLNEINSLKDYFLNRSEYLWSNDEVNQFGAAISNVEYFVGGTAFAQPTSLDEVVISANVANEDFLDPNNGVNLYYGTGLTGRFNKVQMNYNFSTNKYTYTIPSQISGEYVRFYIETISDSGVRLYSPEGAEHNVYIYNIKMDDLSYSNSDVVINEIMASNDMTASDEAGEFDDWIEIYNNGDQSINLEGYHLSDDILELDKYTFPYFILNPDDYVIVWADDDEEDQSNMHATFKLSASGEQLYFSDPNLSILDEVIFGEQQTDMGYARVPNGVGEFIIQYPTFNFNNDLIFSQTENNKDVKKIIKKIDLLGREGVEKGLFIEIFNDGSVVKKYSIQ